MSPLLLAPLTAVVVLAAAAAVLRWQRSSQRKLVGTVVGAAGGASPDILYFTGVHCTICHVAQRPALRRLGEAVSELRIEEVDVVADPETARAYRVMTLPTTVVLEADGRVAALNAGYASDSVLRDQVEAARTRSRQAAVA
jgi:hypothetical protein